MSLRVSLRASRSLSSSSTSTSPKRSMASMSPAVPTGDRDGWVVRRLPPNKRLQLTAAGVGVRRPFAGRRRVSCRSRRRPPVGARVGPARPQLSREPLGGATMLARATGVLAAFVATFSIFFYFQSSWGGLPVTAVAVAIGVLARSRALVIATPFVGGLAYLVTLGLFGQLGPTPAHSVEGFGQVLVNTAGILMGLALLTSVGWFASAI